MAGLRDQLRDSDLT